MGRKVEGHLTSIVIINYLYKSSNGVTWRATTTTTTTTTIQGEQQQHLRQDTKQTKSRSALHLKTMRQERTVVGSLAVLLSSMVQIVLCPGKQKTRAPQNAAFLSPPNTFFFFETIPTENGRSHQSAGHLLSVGDDMKADFFNIGE